jgi:hypothetical protein
MQPNTEQAVERAVEEILRQAAGVPPRKRYKVTGCYMVLGLLRDQPELCA